MAGDGRESLTRRGRMMDEGGANRDRERREGRHENEERKDEKEEKEGEEGYKRE